jgi:hypothetical protein
MVLAWNHSKEGLKVSRRLPIEAALLRSGTDGNHPAATRFTAGFGPPFLCGGSRYSWGDPRKPIRPGSSLGSRTLPEEFGPYFGIEALITVKAYPQPSKTYGESVCMAGIRLDGDAPAWCRLYPVDFRGLPREARFDKYDIVRCSAKRPRRDHRPESLCPDASSIRKVGHVAGWGARAPYLEPLRAGSMCEIKRRYEHDGTSLGVFRPREVTDFHVEAAGAWNDGRIGAIQQGCLFGDRARRRPLQQIPYKFSFSYKCDEPGCRSHKMQLVDWEIGENYRKTARPGRTEEERLDLVRRRWLDEVCGPRRDPWFFVGTVHQHPGTFVLLGVFWPPKASVRVHEAEPTLALF